MPTLPKVDSSRGAPMGRVSTAPADRLAIGRISLQRVPLDSGGYDSGGAYWGLGQPLYWAASECGKVDMFFRARDREHAKMRVRADVPAARFYR